MLWYQLQITSHLMWVMRKNLKPEWEIWKLREDGKGEGEKSQKSITMLLPVRQYDLFLSQYHVNTPVRALMNYL